MCQSVKVIPSVFDQGDLGPNARTCVVEEHIGTSGEPGGYDQRIPKAVPIPSSQAPRPKQIQTPRTVLGIRTPSGHWAPPRF